MTNHEIKRPSLYRAVNTFQLGFKNRSVYDAVFSKTNTKHKKTVWTESTILEC